MRINIKGSPQKQRFYLKAELILKYLIGNDDKIDTMIMCRGSEIGFVTSDQSIYEALGSIKGYDDFKLPKLVKFLEVVDVVSYSSGTKSERKILKDERVEELRKIALSQKEGVLKEEK